MAETLAEYFMQIWDMLLVVLLSTICMSAIFLMTNSNFTLAKATGTQLSWLSSIISDSDIQVEFSYENIDIKENQGEIITAYKDADYEKEYIGNDVNVEKIAENTFKITSKNG